MLRRLLAEIRTAERPVTSAELAGRLDVAQGTVAGMLAALRAQGILASGTVADDPMSCAGAGSCRAICAGPADCPLLVDLGMSSRTMFPDQRPSNDGGEAPPTE